MTRHAIAYPAESLFPSCSANAAPVKFKKALGVTAASVVSSLAVGIWAAPPSTYAIGIFGTVPAICHAELNGAAIDTSEGLVDLGTMSEFCNDGAGYQVWLETTPNAPAGTVYVDSAKFPLAARGATLIHQSEGAARRTSHLYLYLDLADARIDRVTVRIVPL